ncbi:CAP domain-containing protein [Deinococcus cellulosilyticus]|uniref:PKD domain-containing protein n=1 Tax=Deinococcus cellulosilyticus (strain DSM 18568 / NBRC 106333 / KACC 11606 / 5516J-15) TaxID=1223518 RepID=A0A511MZD1_DEIC1|nr:CAP domain-containing protein [Deinococcus cellulosilyticus]GEM45953.1 hypothetical protein DC3_15880 [Deinococcus cellulosilyticus NBRC 106333 = KACC 11606]
MKRALLTLVTFLSGMAFALQIKASYKTVGASRAPAVVQFVAEADELFPAGTRFSWNFGDGTGSEEPNPRHTYYKPGNYRATVQIQVPGMRTLKIDLTVKVEGEQEKAGFVILFSPDRTAELVNMSRIYKPNPVANWLINGKTVQGDRIFLRSSAASKEKLQLSIEGSKGKYTTTTEFKMGQFSQNLPFEAAVLVLTNDLRVKGWNCDTKDFSGTPLPLLRKNATLDRAALAQSVGMAANLYFAHQSPRDNSAPMDRAIAAGYNARIVGENIARGYKTPEEVVDGWAHSHGHCVNIMGDFEEIGVAYIETQDKTNNHYWTQVFGVPFK